MGNNWFTMNFRLDAEGLLYVELTLNIVAKKGVIFGVFIFGYIRYEQNALQFASSQFSVDKFFCVEHYFRRCNRT